jgi:S-adenosylmethionine:tRNA ribosyltransferase-isomerase
MSVAASLSSPLLAGVELDARHVATEPVEATGRRRDDVRLMVSVGDDDPVHATFTDLAAYLAPGDLVVVNTSGTRSAAIDATTNEGALVVHVSTELPGGLWMVEPRQRLDNGATAPLSLPGRAQRVELAGGVRMELLRPAPGSQRLWLASVDPDADLPQVLARRGRPIRYRYVPRDWPLETYQTIFATGSGSAEMPSAARPFTAEVVLALLRRGVGIVGLTLHTGVSSLEGHEMPYPEMYTVPEATAAAINTTRAIGRRVIAVGTTVVRALETAVDHVGTVHPAQGWTDTVVTPERGVRAVDGLLTGWHEPGASHLAMLEAVAGRGPLLAAYHAALDNGYQWHEFGDSHLIIRSDQK